MAAALFIPEIVDQHCENAASLWLIRDNAVQASSFRLADLVKLDERIEANIDGLRIAQASGWCASYDELDAGGTGGFFVAGVLAVESGDPDRLDQIIERAYARAAGVASEPYHPADDPWRGLVSALAWAERTHATAAIERLLDTPRPRTRWLGIAASGARRTACQPGLETALGDREPLVRARAARTAGELGRTDLRSSLNGLLTDEDDGCRFWAAWSAARLGTTEGARALSQLARSPGPQRDHALDVVLRSVSTEHANALLRPLASDPAQLATLIRAVGVVGDPHYVPWLIGQANNPATSRRAGDAFALTTGASIHELEAEATPELDPGPTDDPQDDAVALHDDDGLSWPDPAKLAKWWDQNKSRFQAGTAYFLGVPKQSAHWIGALSAATQRQRRSAAIELALRQPSAAMFEIRGRGDRQRQLLRQVARET